MHLKRMRIVLLIVFVLSLLTACAPPGTSDINCQVSDVNSEPPFLLIKEETAVPATAPFPDQMTAYHRVALAEYQLTYADALCTVRKYEDVDIADVALRLLCLQSQGVETAEQYGEAACGFQNEGVREVHFRRGVTVVTVREDADGHHVSQWAEAVDGRLSE